MILLRVDFRYSRRLEALEVFFKIYPHHKSDFFENDIVDISSVFLMRKKFFEKNSPNIPKKIMNIY